MVAAKKMEKKIHDQLEESNANKQLRVAAFEAALFGTGVMKGPFAVDKEYPNWKTQVNILLLLKLCHIQLVYLFGIFILILMHLIWMKLSM